MINATIQVPYMTVWKYFKAALMLISIFCSVLNSHPEKNKRKKKKIRSQYKYMIYNFFYTDNLQIWNLPMTLHIAGEIHSLFHPYPLQNVSQPIEWVDCRPYQGLSCFCAIVRRRNWICSWHTSLFERYLF